MWSIKFWKELENVPLGDWIAYSPDATRIVAHGPSPEKVCEEARKICGDDFIFGRNSESLRQPMILAAQAATPKGRRFFYLQILLIRRPQIVERVHIVALRIRTATVRGSHAKARGLKDREVEMRPGLVAGRANRADDLIF